MALKSVKLTIKENLTTDNITVNEVNTDGEVYHRLNPIGEKTNEVVQNFEEHVNDTTKHLTEAEHQTLNNIAARFNFTEDGSIVPTASTPPVLPKAALRYQFFNDFFAGRCEQNQYQAPGKVYISRVPYAVKVEDNTNFDPIYLCSSIADIPANTPVEKFDVSSLAIKLMDNAGLNHVYASDTSAGTDDYIGKEWAFWWGRANFVLDEYGNKHITAVKEIRKPGHIFTTKENVGAFGPKFWFFCKRELYQFTDSNGNLRWTTETGEKDGQSITQLWGISDSPWHKLSEEKRTELISHGITEKDFHIWPECLIWDPVQNNYIERPYWVHSAYWAGSENENGTGLLVSKPNLPLRRNNLSHNDINALYGNAVNGVYPYNFGGANSNYHGFGMLFDIIKSGTKHTQKYHSGMTSNYSAEQNVTATLTYKAIPAYDTLEPGYIVPISSSAQFEKYCTVYLEDTQFTSSTKTKYRGITHTKNGSSDKVQVGRILSIEERTFKILDGSSVTSLCLILDSTTVKPFVTRTTEEATAEILASGKRACCYVQQGFALSGETDFIIGKTDGSVVSATNQKHPYRVQGTEYAVGAWYVPGDTVAVPGDDITTVEFDNRIITASSANLYFLKCPQHKKRINNGGAKLTSWINAGYIVEGVLPRGSDSLYVANGELSSSGVYYTTGYGSGANNSNSFGDYFYSNNYSKRAFELMSGGSCSVDASAGSSSIYITRELSYVNWHPASRL